MRCFNGYLGMEDKYEILTDEQYFDHVLSKGVFYANSFVSKNYLINLDQYPVIEADSESKSDDYIRLFKIERVVYDKDEIANDKLISVYSALYNIHSTCVLIIKSQNRKLSFYIGIKSIDNASTAEEILNDSLKGNFPGSIMKHVERNEIQKVLSDVTAQNRFGYRQNVASVSIVPSARDEDKLKFVQGIEKFLDTMRDQDNFTAVFIAEPIGKDGLEQHKQGLLDLQTSLSPFAETQLSYGVNESNAVSKGMSYSFSRSINESLSDTNSNFKSENQSKNRGWNYGLLGMGRNRGRSKGTSQGTSWAHTVTKGTTNTDGKTDTETTIETTGDTKTITVTNHNRAVKYVSDKIDQHIKRIQNCESFGMWDVACYFISENIQTAVVAASTYKALMSGYDSGVENSYVNVWKNEGDGHISQVLESLRYCMHPIFEVPENIEVFKTDALFVNPCCMISGNELPYIMGLPRKSVKGVTVLDVAEFGRNVQLTNAKQLNEKDSVRLGQIFHMGMEEGTRVNLDLNSFSSHCFITGSTGSGKSNTSYRIIDEMIRHNIPFLVVEPAKGEYKRYYGNLDGVNVYCTNPNYYSMLKINPFKFPEEIHVLEHLDRLIEIFNACWPLYAAMPAILKDSFEQAYVRCGWDLEKSIYIPNERPQFPTFRDIMEVLPEIIGSSAYSAESKGNYEGSLVTRIKSLTNGISGQVMCAEEDIDDAVLFDECTIVDLSRVSSLETKSLLMGVMIMKLNEYRMCTCEENQPLRHITVLEEAHNILKRTSGSSNNQESADLQGKSVEMISASIAEMRTYGEGFVIVDQSPMAVDVSAIKNTNTKVVMRLPDYDDSLIAGKSIGLNDEQIHEISRFPMGVAAVYQNNWAEAVLAKIDKSNSDYGKVDEILLPERLAELKGRIAVELIDLFNEKQFNRGFPKERFIEIQQIVRVSDITDSKKRVLYKRLAKIKNNIDRYRGRINVAGFSDELASLLDCDTIFQVLPFKVEKDYSKLDRITKSSIPPSDRVAVDKWFIQLKNSIYEYVIIEDKYINKMLFYLIVHMRNINSGINKYQIIYTKLYGKEQ